MLSSTRNRSKYPKFRVEKGQDDDSGWILYLARRAGGTRDWFWSMDPNRAYPMDLTAAKQIAERVDGGRVHNIQTGKEIT